MSKVKPRMIKPYSGYSAKTADRMLLDAGAFLKILTLKKIRMRQQKRLVNVSA